ncbi:MAG: rhodanese-like domain-containing protein [Bacteroidota bacterium]
MRTDTFRLIVLLCFIVQGLLACTSPAVPEGTVYEVLSPGEFEMKMSEKAAYQLIDVRTPGELKKGYLSGTGNYDYRADEIAKAVEELDKEKPVFVYCGSGIRSRKSATILMKAGFKEIYDMKGGMKAWLAAGKAVVK